MTDIKERTIQFGCKIIKMVAQLPRDTAGYAIGNQIIRSGTAIGAIITEAGSSSSYNDFVHLLRTARKEARETNYWLILVLRTHLLSEAEINPLLKECDEIERILTSSIKTAEKKQENHRITKKTINFYSSNSQFLNS